MPEEPWTKSIGKASGAREIFEKKKSRPPDMVVPMTVYPPMYPDRTRWAEMPHSVNVEDRRGERPTRLPGEPMEWERKLILTPQEQNMYIHHDKNLQKGGVANNDGTISTYRGIVVEQDGKYYKIPTIWDNKVVSNDQALKNVDKVGWDRFQAYNSKEEAEDRYNQIHEFMARDVIGKEEVLSAHRQ